MKRAFFGFWIFAILLCGCELGEYNKFESIKSNEWFLEDTLSFDFSISNSDSYSIFFQVRNTKEYSYNNLWVKIIQDFPSKKMDTSYLFQIVLADPLTGKWLGECTSNYCTMDKPILENVMLKDTGKYKIYIVQYMRKDPIEEISDVGIKVVKNTKN